MKSKRTNILLLLFFITVIQLNTGCEKFLDAKPKKTLAVPSTLTDYQALLDNYDAINNSEASAAEVSSDDYYLATSDWQSKSESLRKMHIWAHSDIFEPQLNDWFSLYKNIYVAGTVLEGLGKITADQKNGTEYNNIKGQAYFIRAKSLLQAAVIWAKAYDEETSDTDLGVPLRQNIDFNEKSVRATLKNTYQQIINDLKWAIKTLPIEPLHLVRPSKPAAYAILARTYLAMRKYDQVLLYADSGLQLKNKLVDYNDLLLTANYPIKEFNNEVLYNSYMQLPKVINPNSGARISSVLYQSYQTDDLRKTAFFKVNADKSYSFKGSYIGANAFFTGPATDELFLMRAESYARTGNIETAMKDLNTLMINRWDKNKVYIPYVATNSDEALNIILTERRKELLMRGLRWMDIKRLNKEGLKINLIREFSGTVYKLDPNAPRYALPIPEEIISISGMVQNQY